MATETHRVLVAGKIHEAGLTLLNSTSGISVDFVEAVTDEAYRPYLPTAEAVLIRTQRLTAADVAAAPKLRIVSRHGVGYDAVDVQALSARAIPLTIVGDVNSRSVAEHTMMLMLAAARRTVAHHLAATGGSWNERNRFDAVELDGKTLLILGFGRIGRRVAELAKAFGMKVSAFDPHVDAAQMQASAVSFAPSLLEALAQTDYVTVHMPAAPAAVIGEKELAAMKPSAILVNAARGGVVDERALDAALRGRRLRAAGLDVLAEEPPSPDHPLLSNPYLTLSPHNAGLTEECAMRMSVAAAQNIIDCFAGTLDRRFIVNSSALQSPTNPPAP